MKKFHNNSSIFKVLSFLTILGMVLIGSPIASAATTIGSDITTGGYIQFGSFGADPAGANGRIIYNSTSNKFRCYENGAWTDCISAGAETDPVWTAALGAGTVITGNWDNTANPWADNEVSVQVTTPPLGLPSWVQLASAVTKVTLYGSQSVTITLCATAGPRLYT